MPAGFSIVQPINSDRIRPGQSATFRVQLDSAVEGSHSGSLSFLSNDVNESPYNFTGVVDDRRIADNSYTGFTASRNWDSNPSDPTSYANNHHYCYYSTGDTAIATWTVSNLQQGRYRVLATWPKDVNRSANVVYTVGAAGATPVPTTVDQQKYPDDLVVANDDPTKLPGVNVRWEVIAQDFRVPDADANRSPPTRSR